MPGFNFVDAGEHVVDYVAGPNGEDVAVHDAIGSARQHMNVSIRQVPAGGLVEAGSVGPPPP